MAQRNMHLQARSAIAERRKKLQAELDALGQRGRYHSEKLQELYNELQAEMWAR